MKHTLATLVCGLALVAPAASAQAILLEDFSSFYQPDHTYFEGDWTAGSYAPRASFIQGDGVYEIKGSTNNQDNFVDIWFGHAGDYAPFDLTGATHIALTAQVLPGNEASAIWIALSDRNMNEATAVFLTGDFSSTASSLVLALIQVHSATFDFSLVDRLRITGNLPLGQAAFNIAFDQIEATAVPEPSAYAVLLGVGALALGMTRRWCSRSGRPAKR
ncbi:PEP-CTERM motif protein [Opitutaceae bacterium TAV1]|nr:PEP-CTERM motif protein [Opitutaceae bacterium TAV1]